MTTILGLSGSLRRASFNTGLLRAAAELAPELTPAGTTILQGSIREVPLYDADLEAAKGLPPAVATLQQCWTQSLANTPKPVFPVQAPQTMDFRSQWAEVPDMAMSRMPPACRCR